MSFDERPSAGREVSNRPTIRRMPVELGMKFLSKRPRGIGRMTTGDSGQSCNSLPQQQPDMAGTCMLWKSRSHGFRTQAIISDREMAGQLFACHAMWRFSERIQRPCRKMGAWSEVSQELSDWQPGGWEHGTLLAPWSSQSVRSLPADLNAPYRTGANPDSCCCASIDYSTDLNHDTANTVNQTGLKYLSPRCTSLHCLKHHSTAAIISFSTPRAPRRIFDHQPPRRFQHLLLYLHIVQP